ncbi:hypothetical protein [Demequina muriae]|uniref:Uncharacterized protein n=1 Tax=Demequina muriae TaxID=3051664 RepID=A0ABT8GDT5_9MICO|nr:hypothetical protein [Demequina sp. EGI L300058]MDN4479590.1 hypothetical protein [Demequina sp. EGI L300058]
MTTAVPSLAASTVEATRPALALRMRRWALIAMPVLAGVLCTIATLADPAPGAVGPELDQAYTDGMAALQIKSFAFHWGYALWALPAVLIAASITQRGRAIANAAAVLGVFALATLPGMLMVDWIQSAIGQLHGPEAIAPVFALVEDQAWAFPLLQVPSMLGLFLALPLAMAALWRAGRVRWWGPAAALLAFIAFMVSAATWPGTVAATALLAIVAVALERATRHGAGS